MTDTLRQEVRELCFEIAWSGFPENKVERLLDFARSQRIAGMQKALLAVRTHEEDVDSEHWHKAMNCARRAIESEMEKEGSQS